MTDTPRRIALLGSGADATAIERVADALRPLAEVTILDHPRELGPGPELAIALAPDASIVEAARALALPVWTWVYGEPGESPREAHRGGRRFLVVRLVEMGPGPEDPIAVLREGAFKAHPLGPGYTLRRLWPAVATWPARVLEEGRPVPPLRTLPSLPPADGARGLADLLAAAGQLLHHLLVEATQEEWQIGILKRPPSSLLASPTLADACWLPPRPGGGFRADPFGIATTAGRFVFCEDCPPGTDSAGLAVIQLDDTGRPVAEFPVETGVVGHLSWPFVFFYGNDLWMLPEHSAGDHTLLLRCRRFPDRFEPAELLLADFPAVDPVLFATDGMFWLFATDRRDEDVTKLHLFSAPKPFGPWRPHPGNPVVCDLRAARPAGPLFWARGGLFRPAQDCASGYGAAITLCRIDRLDGTGFGQTPIVRVVPPASLPDGAHTLAPLGPDWSLVDAKRHRLQPGAAARRLVRRLRG